MHNIIAQELVSAVERNTHSALRYIPNLKVKDLKIKWGGNTASTWWKYNDDNELVSEINFPPIKADAKITNFMTEVYTGFALHEIGHNICTDKDVWDKAIHMERTGHTGILKLLNALEDPRQEKDLLSRCHFEGARNVLEKLTSWASDESIKNGFDPKDPKNFLFTLNTLAYIDWCGYKVPSIGTAEDLLVASGKIRHDLEQALIKLKACKNTQDVLDLCIELMDKHSNQQQPQQGKGTADGSQSEEDQSDNSDNEDQSDSSDSSVDADGSDSSDISDDEDSSDSSDSQSEDGESSEPSKNTVEMDREGSSNTESSSFIDLSNQEFKSKEEMIQDHNDNSEDGLEEYDQKNLKARSYEVEEMVSSDDDTMNKRIETNAKKIQNKLAKLNVSDCSQTLARILRNPDRYGTKRNRDRGKLDARKLGKLCTNTPNMFHQPWKQAGTKTAVSLLIDTSSSMKGYAYGTHWINNSQESVNLALVLGDALHKVQVKYSIGCFPYGHYASWKSLTKSNSYRDKDYYLLKNHDQNWMQSKKNVCFQFGKSDGGTPTHKAMMSEGMRLSKRSEDRKVMIVLTDGFPNQPEKCQQAKDIMSRWGIEVIGMILCPYALMSDTCESEKAKLDRFVQRFDGCFDHYIVKGSAKSMIKDGLKELNKILK